MMRHGRNNMIDVHEKDHNNTKHIQYRNESSSTIGTILDTAIPVSWRQRNKAKTTRKRKPNETRTETIASNNTRKEQDIMEEIEISEPQEITRQLQNEKELTIVSDGGMDPRDG
jgi:hypothetical protein